MRCGIVLLAIIGAATAMDIVAVRQANRDAKNRIVPFASASTITTNVCNMYWTYCPRDPGCKTYTMSVHDVYVHANGYAGTVKGEDLQVGDSVSVEITGITTITSVPPNGSYRIYGVDGKNVAAGVLSDVLTLGSDHAFTILITFQLTADDFDATEVGWTEFGVDIFQEKYGTDEAMCIQISTVEFLDFEKSRVSPPFEMLCHDEGNGHFLPGTVMLEGHKIVSPACGATASPTPAPPSGCELSWYYCPRDPGCVTYAMSVEKVKVVVDSDKDTIAPGDLFTLTVNGTTSLRTIGAGASYRIYDLSGHNAAAGVLSHVTTLYGCDTKGCLFTIHLSFTVPAEAFSQEGWFEVALDTFQYGQETDEAFCMEMANPTYVKYEQTHTQPPPGFDTYCQDMGYGHFVNHTIPEVVSPIVCEFAK